MNVLGLSGLDQAVAYQRRRFPSVDTRFDTACQGLDSAAALVQQGQVQVAVAEERLTKQKGTGAFPVNAIRFCLRSAGIDIRQVERIAHCFAYNKYREAFSGEQWGEIYGQVYTPDLQIKYLQQAFPELDCSTRFVPIPHHLAHATLAFRLSGFDRALVVIADGMGEIHSTTVYLATAHNLRPVATISALHSMGTLFGIFALYLGFRMNRDECKVMALAPYGNPATYRAAFREFVHLRANGRWFLKVMADAAADDGDSANICERVMQRISVELGPARAPGGTIAQRHMDIAASIQESLENAVMHLLEYHRSTQGELNLCFGGGVALNAALNGAIYRRALFAKFFVPPAAGDDGAAVGAALAVANSPETDTGDSVAPFWGPTDETILSSAAVTARGLLRYKFDDQGRLLEETARMLSKGWLVGWLQGRMEFGPRALGARSIFADPSDVSVRHRINRSVKHRESFQPFAPAVTFEAAEEYFEINRDDSCLFRYMGTVAVVREHWRSRLQAVTHIDNTARVQVVRREHAPLLWELLNTFARYSGLPILLNTSLNRHGEPIINSSETALGMVTAGMIDAVVCGEWIVSGEAINV